MARLNFFPESPISNYPPNTFYGYPKGTSNLIDLKPVSVFLLLTLPHALFQRVALPPTWSEEGRNKGGHRSPDKYEDRRESEIQKEAPGGLSVLL